MPIFDGRGQAGPAAFVSLSSLDDIICPALKLRAWPSLAGVPMLLAERLMLTRVRVRACSSVG